MKVVAFYLALFFLPIQTEQAISGTSAATYKVMEPHSMLQVVHLLTSSISGSRGRLGQHQADVAVPPAPALGRVGGQEEGGGGEAKDRRSPSGQGPPHGLLVRRIHAVLQVRAGSGVRTQAFTFDRR